MSISLYLYNLKLVHFVFGDWGGTTYVQILKQIPLTRSTNPLIPAMLRSDRRRRPLCSNP